MHAPLLLGGVALLLAVAGGCSGRSQAQQAAGTRASCASALPAWREGPARRAICDFVARATDVNGRDHIPVEDRIATFDNDGTLWPEQPVIQGAFVLSRVQALAKQDPALAQRQPFKAALAGDMKTLLAAGEPALMELFAATSANMTDDQFVAEARRFLATARHPKLGVPYTALAYQPMIELLDYLRAHGFKTYLSSGGGADFMRVVSQQMYGIPPEQVIGSRPKKHLRRSGGATVLLRLPEVATVNDKEAKPVNIDAQIGRRPVLAAGNVRSGGDIAMLEYSEGGPVMGRRRPSLQLLIDHDDGQREFAYGEKDDASLAAARARGWQVVSMKRDWRIVFRPPPGNI